MKQFAFLSLLTVLGGIGALSEPFWGVLLYYFYATLRPQHLWEWALPAQWRWSLMAAMFVLGGLMLNLHRVLRQGRLNVILIMTIAFAGLLMVSCITALRPQMAAEWAVDFGKILLIAIVSSVLIDQLWHVRWLGVAVLLGIGYIAYEINYLYFFQGGKLSIFHYGFGGLDNNGAGLMLAMGLPFAYAFAAGGDVWLGRWARLIGAGLGVLIMHAVMMTYSRGAMLAGLVGLGWLLIHHRPRLQAVGAAVAVGVLVMVLAGPEIRHRFTSTAEYGQDDSAQSRLATWAVGWQLAWEQPLTGLGVRNSHLVMQSFDTELQGRTIHSLYLQMAADSGIPATVLFITIVLLAMWRLGAAARWCGHHADDDDVDEGQALLQRQVGFIARAAQTSLIVYAFGGIFLSIEVFELAWLMIVIAGVLPVILSQQQAQLSMEENVAAGGVAATI